MWGGSEVALRSLSAVFWLGTVVVMWRIGKELKIPHPSLVGLLALTQPLLVQYAFEARSYAMLGFLTAVSILLFVIKWRLERQERPSLGVNIVLVAVLAAALYTHIFAAWVVLILILVAIWKRLHWWWLVLPIILFGLWVPNILRFSVAGGALPYKLDWHFTWQTLLLLGTPILVLLIPVVPKLWKNEKFQFLAIAWAVPIIGTWVYSKLKQFLFLDRYLIEAVVPMLLLLAMSLREKLGPIIVGSVIVTQAVVAVLIFGRFTFPNPELEPVNQAVEIVGKQPYRDLADYVKSNERPKDLVVNATPLTYLEAHYYGLNSIVYNPHNRHIPAYLGSILIDPRDVVMKVPGASRYWVISSTEGGGNSSDPFPGRLLSTKSFGKLQLSLYVES